MIKEGERAGNNFLQPFCYTQFRDLNDKLTAVLVSGGLSLSLLSLPIGMAVVVAVGKQDHLLRPSWNN